MHEVNTFTATLCVGLREGYTDVVRPMADAIEVVQGYCNEVGLCVTCTPTTFVYSQRPETPHGQEPGLLIGFVNYPRFPSQPDDIRKHAEALGAAIKQKLRQNRVSVVYPDVTRMVGEKQ